MRELVEAPLRPEVVVEVLREHERVGDQRPARVVADQQHRLVGRDLLEPLDLGAEVDVAPRADRGQRALDVLRVARVQPVVGRARRSMSPAERATSPAITCAIASVPSAAPSALPITPDPSMTRPVPARQLSDTASAAIPHRTGPSALAKASARSIRPWLPRSTAAPQPALLRGGERASRHRVHRPEDDRGEARLAQQRRHRRRREEHEVVGREAAPLQPAGLQRQRVGVDRGDQQHPVVGEQAAEHPDVVDRPRQVREHRPHASRCRSRRPRSPAPRAACRRTTARRPAASARSPPRRARGRCRRCRSRACPRPP